MDAQVGAIRALLASAEFTSRLGVIFRRLGTVPEAEAYSAATKFLAEHRVTFHGVDIRLTWRPDTRRVDVDVRAARSHRAPARDPLRLVPEVG
jgi:hypothetical protein